MMAVRIYNDRFRIRTITYPYFHNTLPQIIHAIIIIPLFEEHDKN